MIKKLLFIFLFLGTIISTQAQLAVGEWQVFPTKSTTPGIIYDTDDIVYYMSGASLFSYDKDNNEIETYNLGNYLTDTKIKNIYYNYKKEYLLIIYDNSNIDILYADNRVINIPDLKNTIMMSSKNINDVCFADNAIYMATDFGLLVLNDNKYEVKESYIYNKNFSRIAIAGDNIVAIVDNKLYLSKKESGIYDFAKYWRVINIPEDINIVKYLYTINDNYIFFAYNEKSYLYDIKNDTFIEQTGVNHLYYAKSLNKTKTGFLASFDTNVRFFSNEIKDGGTLQLIEQKNLTEARSQGGYCSSYENDKSIWSSTALGVSHFEVKNNTMTWLMEPASYNTSSVELPLIIQIHDNKLYVKNSGPSVYSVDMYNNTVVSVYDFDTFRWSDLSLESVVRGGDLNSKGALRSSYNLAFDKDSSDVFYIGSWFDGIHKFNGTKYVGNYNANNSPLTKPWEMLASYIEEDIDGNVWALLINNKKGDNSVLGFLSAAKKIKDPKTIKESDWKTFDLGVKLSFSSDLLVSKIYPYCYVVHSVLVSPTRLTVLDRETGKTRVFSTFTDQDGNSFGNGVLRFLCAEEDLNGNLWLGTTSGPIILNNVSNIMSNTFRCTRIKVPRNDGTDYADYLLEDESINAIVVDGANRKWLGTSSSGVYLVSENGTEILQHYTKENSLLPSNMVYSMALNDETGELFVATDMGLASYRSDVSQSSPNYDEVYAFPNPVRPDYSGWITISGLMENSLVKITDVAGNLFCEGYSNGGTFTWDGRTRNGERVKTGIYLVYASQSGGSSGVVTKIMVVN